MSQPDRSMSIRIFDGLSRAYIILFPSDEIAEDVSQSLNMSSGELQALRLKLLMDLTAVFRSEAAPSFNCADDFHQIVSLFMYHGLRYLSLNNGVSSSCGVYTSMGTFLCVMIANAGTEGARLCFPGVSSQIARLLATVSPKGGNPTAPLCGVNAVVAPLAQYLCYGDNARGYTWLKLMAEREINVEVARCHYALPLSVVGQLLCDISIGPVLRYGKLLSLYVASVLSCCSHASSCNSPPSVQFLQCEWLRGSWDRVSAHLLIILRIDVVFVYSHMPANVLGEESTTDASGAGVNDWAASVFRLVACLLNDASVYTDVDEGSRRSLRHVQCLFLLLWDLLGGGGNAGLSSCLCVAARERLCEYASRSLVPSLIASPLYFDFLPMATAGGSFETSVGVDDGGPAVLLLAPAVRFVREVGLVSIHNEGLFQCVTASFTERFCERLCVYVERADAALESLRQRFGFGARGSTPMLALAPSPGVVPASSTTVAASVLDTRGMRGMCDALRRWLGPQRIAEGQHSSYSNVRIATAADADGNGAVQQEEEKGRPQPSSSTACGAANASVDTCVLTSVALPYITDQLLGDWDRYRFHKGAIFVLAGLFDAAHSMTYLPTVVGLRSGGEQSIIGGADGRQKASRRAATGIFGGASVRRKQKSSSSTHNDAKALDRPLLPAEISRGRGYAACVNSGLLEGELWGSLSQDHLWGGVGVDWSLCTARQRVVRRDNVVAIAAVIAHCCRELAAEDGLLAIDVMKSGDAERLRLRDSKSSVGRAARRLSILWLFPLLEKASLQLPPAVGEGAGAGAGGGRVGGAGMSTLEAVSSMRAAATTALSNGVGLLAPISAFPGEARGTSAAEELASHPSLAAVPSPNAPSQRQEESLVSTNRVDILPLSHDKGKSTTAAIILAQRELLLGECCRLLQSPSFASRRLAYTFIATIVTTTAESVLSDGEASSLLERCAPFVAVPTMAVSVSPFADRLCSFIGLLNQLLSLVRSSIDDSTSGLGMLGAAEGVVGSEGGFFAGDGGPSSSMLDRDRLRCIGVLSAAASRAAALSIRIVLSQCCGYFAACEEKEEDGAAGGIIGSLITSVLGDEPSQASAAAEGGVNADSAEENELDSLLKRVAASGGDDGAPFAAERAALTEILLSSGAAASDAPPPPSSSSDPIHSSDVNSGDNVCGGASVRGKGVRPLLNRLVRCVSSLHDDASEGGDANRDALKSSAHGLQALLKALLAAVPPTAVCKMSSTIAAAAASAAPANQQHPIASVVVPIRPIAESLAALTDFVFSLQQQCLALSRVIALHVSTVIGRGRVGGGTSLHSSSLLSSDIPSSGTPSAATQWSAVFPLIAALRDCIEASGGMPVGAPSDDDSNSEALANATASFSVSDLSALAEGCKFSTTATQRAAIAFSLLAPKAAAARRWKGGIGAGVGVGGGEEARGLMPLQWRPLASHQWSVLHSAYSAALPLLVTASGFGLSVEHTLAEGIRLSERIAERRERAAREARQLSALNAKRAAALAAATAAEGGEDTAPSSGNTKAEEGKKSEAAEEDSFSDTLFNEAVALAADRSRFISSSSHSLSSTPSSTVYSLRRFPWPEWLRSLALDAHHAAVIDFMTFLYECAPSFLEARMCEEVAPLLLRVWFRRAAFVGAVRGTKELAVLASIRRFVAALAAGGGCTADGVADVDVSAASDVNGGSGNSSGGGRSSAMFTRFVVPIISEVGFGGEAAGGGL